MRREMVMPPVPIEYSTYSAQQKIEKTKQYYEKIGGLYQRIDGFLSDYENRINNLLQDNASVDSVNAVLLEKNAQILCLYINEFSILKSICHIAKYEEEFNELSILQNCKTIKEAELWMQRCIFLLRRFEFDWEEDGELLELVEEKKISYICLAEILCMDHIVQKISVGSKVARYLYFNGLKREALLFLMQVENKLSYSEKKIMTFAMALLDMGERRLAYEVLLKYQNPNEEIKEMQEMLYKAL